MRAPLLASGTSARRTLAPQPCESMLLDREPNWQFMSYAARCGYDAPSSHQEALGAIRAAGTALGIPPLATTVKSTISRSVCQITMRTPEAGQHVRSHSVSVRL
jgi:hypothetical protein